MLHPSLYASVFNHSPIANCLLSPTPDAIILAVNDAFLKTSSRTREELVGIKLFEVFPRNPADPEDTGESDLRLSLARALATGKQDRLPTQRYPIRVELPGGEVVYEERFWSAVSTPVFDPEGRIACISHMTSDITEQVRAEAALRESENRFRALTKATADVVYRMSPDWTRIHQLEGRGFIKDVTELRDMWLDEYIPVEDHASVHQAIAEAVSNKRVFELEHRVRRIDGTIGWALSRAVPMMDAQGDIYEWIGAASDITERKEAEARLKETDRRKDEFVAMLAHELRNPLAPIRAAAELLQMANQDPARVRQTSQIIGRQVQHMTNLINDLLDVSRVTNGLVTLVKAPLNIRHVLMEAVEQVTPLMQARQHRFAIHLPPGATMVKGDEKRLVQVMTNILSNAAKYTPAHGSIELRTEVHPSQVLIAVTDNGIGMEPELTARVFDLFTQAERTSDRSSGGLGLGLALVKSLVELHGGTVSCESPGPGQGSRFTVCLPRQDAEDELHPPPAADHGAARQAAPLRIMIVDDNVDAATMLAILLEAAGHEVTVAHRPEDALERVGAARPQVCLLDIGLPGMDGHELARRLRRLPGMADALLVAITGYGQEDTRSHALSAGFDHYFIKPIDVGALHQLLATRMTAGSPG